MTYDGMTAHYVLVFPSLLKCSTLGLSFVSRGALRAGTSGGMLAVWIAPSSGLVVDQVEQANPSKVDHSQTWAGLKRWPHLEPTVSGCAADEPSTWDHGNWCMPVTGNSSEIHVPQSDQAHYCVS